MSLMLMHVVVSVAPFFCRIELQCIITGYSLSILLMGIWSVTDKVAMQILGIIYNFIWITIMEWNYWSYRLDNIYV